MKFVKINKPENSNYAATVVEIKNMVPLTNCDNVVGVTLFGQQAIVSKDIKAGDVGIVFPAEAQLSNEFCHNNNLYRHGDKNIDQSQKGYMEDNRRIRAIKFRGNVSNCFFIPLTSLNYCLKPKEIAELSTMIGAEFDEIDGNPICKKYVVPVKATRAQYLASQKNFERVDKIHMPEHNDSDNYHKWGDTIPGDKEIIVTQKLHGTSIRIGNTFTKRKLNIFERLAKALGIKVQEVTHDYVYGSRKVIKDINNPYQNHFYGSDIWTKEGEKLKGILPENFLVYGELIGWTGELPIQKNYTYDVPRGESHLYVYRIAIVNQEGFITDLSWDQLVEFCNERGLKHVVELYRGKKSDFDVDTFMNVRYHDQAVRPLTINTPVQLSDTDTVDEGVCIRVDGMRPRILKAKCSKFFEHETALLDEGVIDLESSQSAQADEVIETINV